MNDDNNGFHENFTRRSHAGCRRGPVERMRPLKEGGSIQCFRGISKPVPEYGA
jgi:hypothetical protein